MTRPDVTAFFDEPTNNVTYVVADPDTRRCAIVDSLLDLDYAAGRTATASADRVIEFVRAQGLTCEWIIDTHIHADHLTGASYLKAALGGLTGIGNRVGEIRPVFSSIFNDDDLRADPDAYDHPFAPGETYRIGSLAARAIPTPGHTPACMSHVIGDAVFVGDTLFMPDYGTARCDFPGGDAGTLYDSIQRLYELPDATRMFLCHDYKAPGRDHFAWETTVGAQKASNVHVRAGVARETFVRMREQRDATLGMPRLILPSLQVNLRGGEFPDPEANGTRYLKVPVDRL